ncbi:N-acetylmuramoyl-L-alanine amidase [Bacillus cereus]|nr:N-acetylmuramoyl-L-alanine amidase [Bacillus cereus]
MYVFPPHKFHKSIIDKVLVNGSPQYKVKNSKVVSSILQLVQHM